MLRYVIVRGLQYSGETTDDMERRECAMQAHNDAIDEMLRRNSLPMLSMRRWAEQHGLISTQPKGETT